jgi:hypothetical protein
MSDDNLYEIAPGTPATKPRVAREQGGRTPGRENLTQPAPLPYAQKHEVEFPPEDVIHRKAPIVLLAAGLTILFAMAWRDATPGNVLDAFGRLGTELLLSTALMLGCVYLAARVRQFNVGPFSQAIIKLMAVSVAPLGAMVLASLVLRFIPFGWIAVAIGGFCLHFALLGVFFDLDQEDTWYVVCIIFIANVAVQFAMLAIW